MKEDLAERTRQRMARLGIPAGTNDPTLRALGAAPLEQTQIAFPPHNIGEEAWTTWVIDVAKWHGWTLRYHIPDSRKVTSRGFPDWTLLHPVANRLVFAELKGYRTAVTEQQRHWIKALNACGVRAFVWRPRDAPAVYEVLSRPSLPSLPGPMMQP